MLCGNWNLPGIEPVSPVLAGGFLPTVLAGKSRDVNLLKHLHVILFSLSSLYAGIGMQAHLCPDGRCVHGICVCTFEEGPYR